MCTCREVARSWRRPAKKCVPARQSWRGLKTGVSDSGQHTETATKRERGARRAKARQIVAARLERLEDLSISKLVPSTLTLMGVCSGATAIRFALLSGWRAAVACVVLAMIFDMLDGRAARMFGADTRFGAQLDSLADL